MYFLHAIVLLSVLYLNVDGACPPGWLAHGSSCYHFSHDTEEWIGALNICRVLGGQLVEIETAEENKFITAQAKIINKSFWIGMSDLQEEGTWTWMNSKTPLTTDDFSNWHSGQPDNDDGNENCVNLEDSFNMEWNDLPCRDYDNYICEKPNDDLDIVG